jgi:hypothetical protein
VRDALGWLLYGADLDKEVAVVAVMCKECCKLVRWLAWQLAVALTTQTCMAGTQQGPKVPKHSHICTWSHSDKCSHVSDV